MRQATLLAVVVALLTADIAQAGPFWWLRPRNWGRRNRTTVVTTVPANVGDDAPVVLTGMNLDIIQEMHETDREYREAAGLEGLILHSKLCEVAQAHAENMARKYNMSHYLDGSPWNRAYSAGWHESASENIASGYNSVAAAYGGWYSSRSHRRNMLGNHKYCGFGYATAENGRRYWAAMYSD